MRTRPTTKRKTRGGWARFARKMKQKFANFAGKPTNSQTTHRKIMQSAQSLRYKTVSKIDAKIKTLKAQIAKRLNVPPTNSKVTSSAIKRLLIKRRQIANCMTPATLVKLCKTLNLSSYKNPKAKKSKTSKHSTKHTTYKKKKTKSTYAKAKPTYSKQTTLLKREISTLKQRNTFMKKQVAKFRKEAAKLKRHYGALSTKVAPRWKVIKQQVRKDVSNIINFSDALNSAIKQRRKAG